MKNTGRNRTNANTFIKYGASEFKSWCDQKLWLQYYLPLWCERVAPQNFYVPKTCSTCTMQSCTSLGECLVWPFWPKQPSRKRRWIIAHHTTALLCVLRSPALCTFPLKFSYGKYFFSQQFFSWWLKNNLAVVTTSKQSLSPRYYYIHTGQF